MTKPTSYVWGEWMVVLLVGALFVCAFVLPEVLFAWVIVLLVLALLVCAIALPKARRWLGTPRYSLRTWEMILLGVVVFYFLQSRILRDETPSYNPFSSADRGASPEGKYRYLPAYKARLERREHPGGIERPQIEDVDDPEPGGVPVTELFKPGFPDRLNQEDVEQLEEDAFRRIAEAVQHLTPEQFLECVGGLCHDLIVHEPQFVDRFIRDLETYESQLEQPAGDPGPVPP